MRGILPRVSEHAPCRLVRTAAFGPFFSCGKLVGGALPWGSLGLSRFVHFPVVMPAGPSCVAPDPRCLTVMRSLMHTQASNTLPPDARPSIFVSPSLPCPCLPPPNWCSLLHRLQACTTCTLARRPSCTETSSPLTCWLTATGARLLVFSTGFSLGFSARPRPLVPSPAQSDTYLGGRAVCASHVHSHRSLLLLLLLLLGFFPPGSRQPAMRC